MTTDPTNHRLAGQSWLDNAIDWYGQIDDSDPWEKTTASALIAGAFFLAARDGDDPLDGEEQHQSEKFEFSELFPRRELDEDNPDTLVGDAGLVDDADTIARPLSFGGILDTPRTDFYGTPGPWSAA